MTLPHWFTDGADFTGDSDAYVALANGDDADPGALHRAGRHYNWLQSPEPVRSWTRLAHNEAKQACHAHCWSGLSAPTFSSAGQVTHRRVQWIRDPELSRRILDERDNPDTLRKAAVRLHRALADHNPEGILWLGDQEELDRRHAFEPEGVQTLLAVLGLWHFGDVSADDSGAVLRIVYRLDAAIPRFKPDWRHGYPNFYFACATDTGESGMTRDLASGHLACKEWVVKLSDIDPHRHIVAARCVIPGAACNHSEPPNVYWQTLTEEIDRYAKAQP